MDFTGFRMDSDLKWTLEIQVWTVAIFQGQSLAAADFRTGLNQSPGFAEDDLAYFSQWEIRYLGNL